MKKYMNERGFRIIDALHAVAANHNSTPASVALAWLRDRPSILAPIASATNNHQLMEIISSASLVLNEADVTQLDDASAG